MQRQLWGLGLAILCFWTQSSTAFAQTETHVKIPVNAPIIRTIDVGFDKTLVVSEQGEVVHFNPSAENPVPEKLTKEGERIADLAPLRDQSGTILLSKGGELQLLRDDAAKPELLMQSPVLGQLFAAFSHRALVVDKKGNYALINVDDKTAEPTKTFPDFGAKLKVYDDLTLAAYANGESLHLADVASGEKILTLPVGELLDYDVSKQRRIAVVASSFGGVQFWDLVHKEPLDIGLGMFDEVWYLKFLPSGDLLAITRDGVATVYQSGEWRSIHTFQVPPMSELRFAEVSENNELMLTTKENSVHTIPMVLYGFAREPAPAGYFPVQLWYATNRLPSGGLGTFRDRLFNWLSRPDVIGVFIVVALLSFIVAMALAKFPRRWRALYSVIVACLTLLVLTAILFPLVDRQATLAQSSPENYFGNVLDESGKFTWGRCEVTVPTDRLPGDLDEPLEFLGFKAPEDPEKHFILTKVEPTSPETIIDEVKAKGEPEEILIFVHGYNVPFAAAAKRTAQLKVDLDIDGEAFFFSWPSHGNLSQYLADEDNARLSATPFQEMLKTICDPFKNTRIHIIGHSMGTRIVHESLRQMYAEKSPTLEALDSLVLAAPDIDRRQFHLELEQIVRQLDLPITLYASANDKALMISGQLHDNTRLGDVAPEPVIVPGVETIDCSMINTDFLGHGYYGDSDDLLKDLFQVIRDDRRAEQRFGLILQQLDDKRRYWHLLP
ncbi:alpha/beta fold hydrolase [Blastopirellula sp. JC732]|uniref:Alpha/beta fold hydrolase n=1 Tax=Blastopirellula sediminis TaxID=2894196 RepID=A0A9X1MRX9_9BACT|nr:alpha/beta hydrolase [Blastopirellula sediminis]MCC9605049.1 alpha/beta fold hydrolase [Blastopirellula sediminis]MCC9631651.1 alpha/beta fold hydrolase [Blastopirellula sediminis]